MFGLGQAGGLGESEAQGASGAPELVEGCLLWGRGLGWTGCHWSGGTEGGGSSEAGREVVAAEEVEGQVEATREE